MIRPSNRSQSEMSASPDKYPQGKFKDKSCRKCGEVFSPRGPSHHYCSDNCKDYVDTDNYYQNTYGVSYQDVLNMLEKQAGKCAICQDVGFKMHKGIKHSLVLDHCHVTKQVRGLLCHNCNRALGLMKDNINYLNNAIRYLEGATTIRKE